MPPAYMKIFKMTTELSMVDDDTSASESKPLQAYNWERRPCHDLDLDLWVPSSKTLQLFGQLA